MKLGRLNSTSSLTGPMLALSFMLALGLMSCSSRPTKENAAEEKASSSQFSSSSYVKSVLSKTKALFNYDEALEGTSPESAEQAEIQLSINEILDELLKLDPKADKDFAANLIADLHNYPDQSVSALKMMMSEDRPENEMALLLQALSSFDTKAAKQALVELGLATGNKEIKKAAIEEVKGSREFSDYAFGPDSSNAKDKIQDKIYRAELMAASGNSASAYILRDALGDSEDPAVRKSIIEALGRMESDKAIEVLISLIEGSPDLVADAAAALGRMNNENGALSLVGFIWSDDASTDLKLAAAKGLGQGKSPAALNLMQKILLDETLSGDIHQAAVDGLLTSDLDTASLKQYMAIFMASPSEHLPQMLQPLIAKGKDEAVKLIASNFSQMNDLKKVHAIRTLGRIGNFGAFDYLKDLITFSPASQGNVRREALDAISKCDREMLGPEMTDIFLRTLATSKDKDEQQTALKYLQGVSPKDAVDMAEKFIYAGREDMIQTSVDILREAGGKQSLSALRTLKLSGRAESIESKIEEAIQAIEARLKS